MIMPAAAIPSAVILHRPDPGQLNDEQKREHTCGDEAGVIVFRINQLINFPCVMEP